jgi:phosphoglycerate dehydrogenase-like enzyme
MTVAAVDRKEGNRAELEAMLRQADFLVIAAPLTGETRGLIGKAEIELLPRQAFVVNVSRAEIIEEAPLYEALESGRLAGAALDVWYQYPKPGEDGYGSRFPFHVLPGVYCTPHYSAWSEGMILRRIGRMCETLKQLERGEELDRVVMVGTWRP